ncbi:MAG: hypothetical protein KGI11_09990 [Thaumarchaeota archaeon]|nr:hypothetical protein [Nitrososphaerota archaeon]
MPEISEKYKPQMTQINPVLIIKNHNQSALSAFRYYTTFLPELRWQAGIIQHSLLIAVGSVQFSSLQGRRTKPGQPHQAGHPEKIILSGLTKAAYALFLPLTQILPAILPYIFYEHSYFQTIAVFSCRPPHTLFRQDTARTGKKWQHYTAQSGHGARITHQTPVSCVKVCNSKEEIMNPPLEGREAGNIAFSVQKCAINDKLPMNDLCGLGALREIKLTACDLYSVLTNTEDLSTEISLYFSVVA